MIKILLAAIAVVIAAGIAYVVVVPGALDQMGVEMASGPAPAQPTKDDSRISTPSSATTTEQVDTGEMPSVGVLDLAALPFETGCGLHLSREGEDGIIFVDAMPGDTAGEGAGGPAGAMPATMMIDGTPVTLARSTADGETIGFGQYPRQVFDSADNKVRVVIEIDFGEDPDEKQVPVSAGELTVMKAGQPTLKFAVSGAGGC
jgi:hypothetical protein